MNAPTTPPDTLDRAQKANYSALRKFLCSKDADQVLQGLELLRALADPALVQTFGAGITVRQRSYGGSPTNFVDIGRGDTHYRDNTAWVGWHVRTEHRATVGLALARALGLLEGVTSLRIDSGVWSVMALDGLTELAEIFFTDCRAIASLHGLAHLPKLESLRLSQFPITTLEGLSDLPALHSISLYHCAKLEDVSALAALTTLRAVKIFACPLLRRLDVLAGLPLLETVDLSGAPSLEDIGFVATLPALRELDVGECTEIRRWQPLAQAASLVSLRVDETSFEDLSLLAGLQRLESLFLYQCKQVRDLRPLLGLASLRELNTQFCHGLPGTLQGDFDATTIGRLLEGLRDDRVRLQRVVDRLLSAEPDRVAAGFRILAEDPDLAAVCAPLLAAVLQERIGERPVAEAPAVAVPVAEVGPSWPEAAAADAYVSDPDARFPF